MLSEFFSEKSALDLVFIFSFTNVVRIVGSVHLFFQEHHQNCYHSIMHVFFQDRRRNCCHPIMCSSFLSGSSSELLALNRVFIQLCALNDVMIVSFGIMMIVLSGSSSELLAPNGVFILFTLVVRIVFLKSWGCECFFHECRQTLLLKIS